MSPILATVYIAVDIDQPCDPKQIARMHRVTNSVAGSGRAAATQPGAVLSYRSAHAMLLNLLFFFKREVKNLNLHVKYPGFKTLPTIDLCSGVAEASAQRHQS